LPDQEIILGKGLLLGLFFGLVALCGVFFSLGFSMGRNSATAAVSSSPSADATPPTSKIADSPKLIIRKPGCGSSPEGCSSGDDSTRPPAAASSDALSKPETAVPASSISTGPATGATPPPANADAATEGFIVQVAAVSKQQDADALVSALKKKQYQVFVATTATDNLFHVQIGPFSDPKDADAIRTRLIADGYNPIVKKT
jgi:cell division septation protein DedD